MAKFFDIHPDNPQQRLISQVADALRNGAVIAYPTDSGYALGCAMDNHFGSDRIRAIRDLDERHHMTLVCSDFSQLGQLVILDNHAFRAIKAATPGPYTFILPATKEVPRRLAHPKKKTVGVRIPDNEIVRSIIAELGEPILSSSLILPDIDSPLTEGWQIKEELDHVLDAVVEAGDCGEEPTTVIDYSSGSAEVVRVGAGDTARFE
ncbi:L-threonylcarbamoyladenylate synthase [Jonesia denitrificans]|uniref:Sua5/YciO/YrdC/YwlC family protein n=1 Tax=Jonesia denitrificans (strain ATCC 14870 / DSM 20603 / BCRC 15368 / CIP 55.134 / JCM 11481 / NBRC 15587 / NCTC 10816 / Prevot 55134) TaxID=471856 RepID=C7R2U2_JONDD|nr:L-threonylcarbamoyladenylate synthase [Jonesia denitrificans]ACV08564.1 Sua5/YciO/YrdC/YwlC family protein [Jonesia denitrificans DSM 20603]ASE07811.1 threonylcarbamoyl-AMP synthase [Jonesia denitrificans]QXB42420.1 threonylcarbamoyl-AMP synthase [Jonesia denitrificans]SQH20549.1 Putative translation factor (SUA5) [Jonesia denitrificans]